MITIQEAITRTEKSETTIRRFVRKHKGSKHIKKIKGIYHINEKFLFKQYPPSVSVDDNASTNAEGLTGQQLIAGEQVGHILDNLQEQIKELHQRIREQNHIIMKMAEQHDNLLKAPIYTKRSPSKAPDQAPKPSSGKPPQMIAPIEAAMMLVVALGIISLVIYMFMSLSK